MLTMPFRKGRSGRKASRRARKLSTTRRLCHEPLEDRRLLSLSYPDFSDPSGLSLVAEAAISNSRMQLTPPGWISTVTESGAVWHTEKQLVATPFETQFEFQLESASGLAFVIQNLD